MNHTPACLIIYESSVAAAVTDPPSGMLKDTVTVDNPLLFDLAVTVLSVLTPCFLMSTDLMILNKDIDREILPKQAS